jgi:hypothetical protein
MSGALALLGCGSITPLAPTTGDAAAPATALPDAAAPAAAHPDAAASEAGPGPKNGKGSDKADDGDGGTSGGPKKGPDAPRPSDGRGND